MLSYTTSCSAGAERDIIMSLKDWIATNKPSMLLSMVRAAAAVARVELLPNGA
jgi:hypothetical protein